MLQWWRRRGTLGLGSVGGKRKGMNNSPFFILFYLFLFLIFLKFCWETRKEKEKKDDLGFCG